MLFLGTAYDNTFSIWKLSINSLFQLTSVYGGFASRSLSHNKGSNFLCSSLLALHSSLVLLKRKKNLPRERSIWLVRFFWPFPLALSKWSNGDRDWQTLHFINIGDKSARTGGFLWLASQRSDWHLTVVTKKVLVKRHGVSRERDVQCYCRQQYPRI